MRPHLLLVITRFQTRCEHILRKVIGQVFHIDKFGPAHEDGAAYDVLQFPDISRPDVPLEQIQDLRGYANDSRLTSGT